jgi:16S rRNA (guanine966-N2)-methyltransferase
VRESLFNILSHGGAGLGGEDVVRDARVLDAFAGTGALGLEALSRGAGHVTMIDNDSAALNACRANVAALGEQARTTVLSGNALVPVRAAAPCTLVLMDPPWRGGAASPALVALDDAGWIASGAVCVIEIAANEEFAAPQGFEVADERRYGAARIVILRRA